MGMGDVKLIIFLGLITGFPEILLLLFIAFVSGGLLAGTLLAQGVVSRKDSIAFGPYLALAGMITLLYGDTILSWWLRRFGL
jgi:leader peptidase (prepilin peptidase)/N-methyltransferase